MKKVLKLMAALGIISLMISFVSCSLLTEAELKVRNNEQPNNGGPATGGGSDTIGNAWGALFSNTNHSPIDLQVWQNFEAIYNDNGMNVKFKATEGANGDWFGGAIVQNMGQTPANSIYYDMSSVAKVTFQVKATTAMPVWVGYSNQNQTDSLIKQNINVTTDWQTITINSPGVAKAWAIFALGCDNPGKVYQNATLSFKDVTYLNSNGESVTLKYVQ
jgi:hypothetical protein